MYLTGTYKHTLDAKSRIMLPSAFRKQLGETVCLVPLNDCIYGFTPESHRAWIERFFPGGINPRNRKDVALRAGLLSRTLTVELDGAGRLALGKLDASRLSACNIEREVAIVGVDDHFEIWNASKFEDQTKAFDDNLESLMFED